MRGGVLAALLSGGTLMLASCAPPAGTVKAPAETKETMYARGHELYITMKYSEAERELMRAASMDSTYRAPLIDLGSLWFDLGKKGEGARRKEDFRKALGFLARAEALGYREADGYEMLCEICTELDDPRGFLLYARKNAERYPFDRQYYNLGVACFGVEDWAGVVKSQREAAEKFRESPYIGAFYRQMGRAYMKMDRDQTAERTLESGVQAVDARIAGLRKSGAGGSPEQSRRLQDDKIGMLLLLRHLHTTYREPEKLAQVERELREAGYTK